MTPYYADGQATLYLGDVRDVLRELPTDSVSMVCTSPPYWGLRSYGIPPSVWGGDQDCVHEWGEELTTPARKETAPSAAIHKPGFADPFRKGKAWVNHKVDATPACGQFCRHCSAWLGCLGLEPDVDSFIAHLVSVFEEVRRVLHPSGTVWVNIGDSYAGGGRGGHELAVPPQGRGNAYPQSIIPDGLKPKDLCMVPARFALAMQAAGWWLRSEITLCKVAPMPESVTDRPTSATEKLYLFSKRERYFYDSIAIKEPAQHWTGLSATFDRPNGKMNELRVPGQQHNSHRNGRGDVVDTAAGRNARNFWEWRPDGGFDGQHFATFPVSLPKRCIAAGTSEHGVCSQCREPWRRVVEREYEQRSGSAGGRRREADPRDSRDTRLPKLELRTKTHGWAPGCKCEAPVRPAVVLDPFCGSGTTLQAAKQLGRYSVGIDLKADYLDMAIRRAQQMALLPQEAE